MGKELKVRASDFNDDFGAFSDKRKWFYKLLESPCSPPK